VDAIVVHDVEAGNPVSTTVESKEKE